LSGNAGREVFFRGKKYRVNPPVGYKIPFWLWQDRAMRKMDKIKLRIFDGIKFPMRISRRFQLAYRGPEYRHFLTDIKVIVAVKIHASVRLCPPLAPYVRLIFLSRGGAPACIALLFPLTSQLYPGLTGINATHELSFEHV
jgi:hypothetical protein